MDKGTSPPRENNRPRRHGKVVEFTRNGHQFTKQRNWAKAKESFSQALDIEPDNAYALTGLGDVCRNIGEMDNAIACYRQVLQSDRRNLFALRGLGDALRERKEYKEAIELWQRYRITSYNVCYTKLLRASPRPRSAKRFLRSN